MEHLEELLSNRNRWPMIYLRCQLRNNKQRGKRQNYYYYYAIVVVLRSLGL